jgi:PAS domain S-box-containing protein
MDVIFGLGPYYDRILPYDINEVEMRCVSVALIMALSYYAQVVVRRSRATQAALQAAEKKYRSIFDNALEGIFQLSADGRLITANRMMSSIIGYASLEELSADVADINSLLFADPAQREDFMHAIERDNIVSFEGRGRRKDGNLIWLSVHARAVRDADGKLLYIEGLVADISERKQAEAELSIRTREQVAVATLSQRALSTNSLAALLDRALALVAQTLEAELCAIFELQPNGDTLLLRAGIGWQEGLVGQATIEARSDNHARYTLQSTLPVIMDDGRHEVRFSISPLLQNHNIVSGITLTIYGQDQPFGMLGAYTRTQRAFTSDDAHFLHAVVNVLANAITRARTEEVQARLAAIVESTNDAIISKTLDGRILSWNSAAQRLLGYTAIEVNGKPIEMLLPPDRANDLYVLLERVGQGERVEQIETVLATKAGQPLDVALTISPIKNAAGAVVATSTIARDISARKQVAAERERLIKQLEAGNERLHVLSRRLLEVQEKERRYIARELHDQVGQDLTALNVNLQALQSLPALAGIAPGLQESTDIVARVLRQVRYLTLELRPSLLDDLGLPSALRAYARRHAQSAGLDVQVTTEPLASSLPHDLETTCFRIVQEALTNIVRHARAQRVGIELRQNDSTIELIIRDNGIGFDPQAVRARDRRREHGRPWHAGARNADWRPAHDRLGPRRGHHHHGPPAADTRLFESGIWRATTPMTHIRVMLVDNHALLRATLRSVLEKAPDIEIIAEAANGRDAVRLIMEQQPDIVLLDIAMPVMNGLDVARMVKGYNNVRIVMLSMHSDEEYVEQALQAGAMGYVLKDAIKIDALLAIRAAVRGERYFSAEVSREVIDAYLRSIGSEAPAPPKE